MTIRLLRHLHHNVTKPVLRVKRDLLRTALGKPVRRDETPQTAAAATSPATRPPEAPQQAAPSAAATTRRTKVELYEEATRRNVKGRSSMTKAQLIEALAEH